MNLRVVPIYSYHGLKLLGYWNQTWQELVAYYVLKILYIIQSEYQRTPLNWQYWNIKYWYEIVSTPRQQSYNADHLTYPPTRPRISIKHFLLRRTFFSGLYFFLDYHQNPLEFLIRIISKIAHFWRVADATPSKFLLKISEQCSQFI